MAVLDEDKGYGAWLSIDLPRPVVRSHQLPARVCEMALARTVANKAEAAYRRGDLFDGRRKLTEAWAAYCASTKSGKVVPLRRGAAA
jgi:hypothetical protein